MDNETNHKLPENATWGDAMGLISDLIAENAALTAEIKANRDEWATEVIAQAKRHSRYLAIALLVSIAGFLATNAYWIHELNSYEYVYQDGTGKNNYNNNVAGDVNNVAAGESEEEWQEPGSEVEENR